jgi:hypothetical protein
LHNIDPDGDSLTRNHREGYRFSPGQAEYTNLIPRHRCPTDRLVKYKDFPGTGKSYGNRILPVDLDHLGQARFSYRQSG